jgi:IS1 family transposase
MSYVVTLKKNKIWIWCAYSRDRKQVLGFYVGDRSGSSAEKLYMQIKNFKIEKFLRIIGRVMIVYYHHKNT